MAGRGSPKMAIWPVLPARSEQLIADLRVDGGQMSDFGASSWQHRSHSQRDVWVQGSSWGGRAAWKQVSSSEEAVVASCAAAKTGIFNTLIADLLSLRRRTSPPRGRGG